MLDLEIIVTGCKLGGSRNNIWMAYIFFNSMKGKSYYFLSFYFTKSHDDEKRDKDSTRYYQINKLELSD